MSEAACRRREGGHECPDCGSTHDKMRGLKMHYSRSHDGVGPWVDVRSEKYWSHMREQIRERDDKSCRRCGHEEGRDEHGNYRGVEVHHIVKRERFIGKTPHVAENLVCLCVKCHTKLEDMSIRAQLAEVGELERLDSLSAHLPRSGAERRGGAGE